MLRGAPFSLVIGFGICVGGCDGSTGDNGTTLLPDGGRATDGGAIIAAPPAPMLGEWRPIRLTSSWTPSESALIAPSRDGKVFFFGGETKNTQWQPGESSRLYLNTGSI